MRFTTAALVAALMMTPAKAQSEAQTAVSLPEGFDAGSVLVLSDGAMLASGYIDGHLGPRRPDLLSVINPENGARTNVGVSNSVATWPNTMALTPDGRFAIVAEPFAQPPESAETFEAIERGRKLTVIDLADSAGPKIVQTLDAPSAPAAVDVHPSGNVVAVTLPFAGQIAIYPLADGQLGDPSLHELQVENLANTFVPEFSWRPDGQFAAVTLGGADRVVFYRFDEARLAPWGPPVRTAPLPGMGVWTPDGQHYLVTTITATGDMAQVSYGQNASLLAVIAFDETQERDSLPRRANDRRTTYESPAIQHARLGHFPLGQGYVESIAISPDGRNLAVANMRASWLPKEHPGRSDGSEVTLFSFDPARGRLERIANLQLPEVILPQGLTFDADGSHIALTSFQHDDRDGGSLYVFALTDQQSSLKLRQIGNATSLPRGAHHLVVKP